MWETQNELITLCGNILKEDAVCEANVANAFLIISDEASLLHQFCMLVGIIENSLENASHVVESYKKMYTYT